MNHDKRIPLAWSARWRRIRLQMLPVACFALAMGAAAWLWQRHGAAFHGVGVVDALRIDVTSPIAGLIISLPHQARGQWSLYDSVQAGDVLARFDDRQLQTDKSLLRQAVKQFIEQVSEEQAGSLAGVGPGARDAVRRAWQVERSRLSVLEQTLGGSPETIPADENAALGSPPEVPDTVSAATRAALARVRDARQDFERRRDDLGRQADLLDIRAPISGTLVAVHCWPGQTVHPGSLIATIAADHGRHIVTYIPEGSRVVPQPGLAVAVRPRSVGARRATSQIEQVGRQIERVPAHHLQSPASGQWGLPVLIQMPADAPLQPGALVDVMFHSAD